MDGACNLDRMSSLLRFLDLFFGFLGALTGAAGFFVGCSVGASDSSSETRSISEDDDELSSSDCFPLVSSSNESLCTYLPRTTVPTAAGVETALNDGAAEAVDALASTS